VASRQRDSGLPTCLAVNNQASTCNIYLRFRSEAGNVRSHEVDHLIWVVSFKGNLSDAAREQIPHSLGGLVSSGEKDFRDERWGITDPPNSFPMTRRGLQVARRGSQDGSGKPCSD